MRILIGGASGLLGSALVSALRLEGHEITFLVRGLPRADSDEIYWQPETGKLDLHENATFEAVVNLSGDNIGNGRWTPKKKARIRNSRIEGTKRLAHQLSGLKSPPSVWINASAVGYYGSRGDELLTEQSSAGTGFLAEVVREWEQATEPFSASGMRIVLLRFGIILSRDGGALAKMLLPFRLGLGGRIGNGRQYMPWITIQDAVHVIQKALVDEEISGPINVAAPDCPQNAEFTRVLGKVLRRPAFMPLPATAARLLFGSEMANETLLSSTRVRPTTLDAIGFSYGYPQLESALRKQVNPRSI